MSKHVEELRRYVTQEYAGDLDEAMASVGGIRRLRAILGEPDLSVTDPAFHAVLGFGRCGIADCFAVSGQVNHGWCKSCNAQVVAAGTEGR